MNPFRLLVPFILALFMISPAFAAAYSTDGLIGYWNMSSGTATVGDNLDNYQNMSATQGISGGSALPYSIYSYNEAYPFKSAYYKDWNSTYEGLWSPYSTGQLSVAFWFRMKSIPLASDGFDLVGIQDSGCNYDLFASGFLNSGTPGVYLLLLFNDCGGTLISIPAEEINKWYFFAGTFNGTTLTGYLYDENGFNATASVETTGAFYSNFDEFSIGNSLNDVYASSLNGSIDEVFYYNRSLNSTEVDDLWNYTVGLDEPYTDEVLAGAFISTPYGLQGAFNVSFDFYYGDNIGMDACWYVLDGESPVYLSCPSAYVSDATGSFIVGEGSHYVEFWANDSAGNPASFSNSSFSAEAPAYISITQESPLDGGNVYYNKNVSINFTISTNRVIDKCWMFWDNYFTGWQPNYTITDCQNTSIIALPYVNYFGIWVNTTNGESNCSSSYYDGCFPDFIPNVFLVSPTAVGFINMSSPENISYELSSSIDLNFTAVFNETGITGTCEYSLDGGGWTGADCYNNYTLTGLSEAQHDVQVRMSVDGSEINNDYMLSPDIFFTLTDLILPTVAVQSPTGIVTSPFNVNYTVWDVNGIDSCWYGMDSGSNVSIPSCANFTDSGSSGDHNLTVYANDTFGNTGSATSPFSVLAPLIPPTANVTGLTAIIYILLPLLIVVLILPFAFYEVPSGRMSIKDAFLLVIISIIMVIVAAGIIAASV
jgi:hypothetical protein